MSAPAMAPAQQPGLRSFIVQSHIPDGCISFEVKNSRAAPHLRRGDFAIVDTCDRTPAQGELFAIRWMGGSEAIVEVRRSTRHGHDGHTYWSTYTRSPIMSLDGEVIDARWADGPFETSVLEAKLIGRVVALHEPDFRHQLQASPISGLPARIAGAKEVADLEALRDELFASMQQRLPLADRIRIMAAWERRRGELDKGSKAA